MRLTISGEGFEPGQRAALIGGGPFVVGSYGLSEGAHGVEVTAGHACVTFYSHTSKLGGIQLLDFSDPAAPIRLGSFETGDSGLDVRMSGPLAIFTFLNPYTFLGGLHIVDVSDPADPRRVGTFDTLLDPRRFAVAGTLVYVAAGVEGLKVIDLEDPSAPRLVAEFDTPGAATDVKLAGSLAYVADDDALLVFDVGDPAHPIVIGSLYGEERSVTGLAIAGPRLVATDARGGLQLIDISDPARPRSIARVPLRSSICSAPAARPSSPARGCSETPLTSRASPSPADAPTSPTSSTASRSSTFGSRSPRPRSEVWICRPCPPRPATRPWPWSGRRPTCRTPTPACSPSMSRIRRRRS